MFYKLFSLILLSLPLSVFGQACDDLIVEPDPLLEQELDAFLNGLVEEGFAGGVSVIQNCKFVYERFVGFADRAGAVSVTSETLFQVASITKYVTAVLALKAQQQGLVDLDEPLTAYLPRGTKLNAGTTLRDLLTHRSGLGSSYVGEKHSNQIKALRAIGKAPIDKSRVGKFRYSNDAYDLTAIILEQKFGLPFEEILQQELFAPIGLATPRHWGQIDMRDPKTLSQPLEVLPKRSLKRSYGMLGASGLLITATNLVLFEHALVQGKLLNRDSLDQLRRVYDKVSIGQTMMGSFLVQHPDLGKVVSARGYEDWGDNAILNHYLEKDIVVAAVTSRGPAEGQGSPYRSQISKKIEQVLAKKDF